jgi:transcriptional regulator with XRE-family HTH domain
MIRRLRKRLGLTQFELGELMNVDQGTISRWERDIESPRPARQAKLRSVLVREEDRRHMNRCLAIVRNNVMPSTLLDANLRLVEASASAKAFFRARGQDFEKIMGTTFYQYLDRIQQPELADIMTSAELESGNALLFRFATNYKGNGNLTVWEPVFEDGEFVAIYNFVSSTFSFPENHELSIEYADLVTTQDPNQLITLFEGPMAQQVPGRASGSDANST